MDTDGISKGCVVESLAGRDKGNLFFVLECEDNYALLIDGKIRRIENPKRKKLKHLRFFALREDTRLYAKLKAGVRPDNAEVRKALTLFVSSEERS